MEGHLLPYWTFYHLIHLYFYLAVKYPLQLSIETEMLVKL